MLVDIILVLLVLVAVLATSITDIKTREVPDWISYMLIVSALSIRLLYAMQTKTWSYFLYGLLGLAAMAFIGILLFYTKQWGGGDAKLLMGIGAAWGTTPYFISTPGPFLVYFLIGLAVMGALYGLLYSIVLLMNHFAQWKKEYLKLQTKQLKQMKMLCIALGVIILIFLWILQQNPLRITMVTVALMILLYPYFYQMLKAVENATMYKKIPIARLTEGDWIADQTIRKRFSIPAWGVEHKHIEQLKKSKMKHVLIKEGIPFIPSFFFAVLFALNIDAILALL